MARDQKQSEGEQGHKTGENEKRRVPIESICPSGHKMSFATPSSMTGMGKLATANGMLQEGMAWGYWCPTCQTIYTKPAKSEAQSAIVKVKEKNYLFGERTIVFTIKPKPQAIERSVDGYDVWSQVGDGKRQKHTKGTRYAPGPLDYVIEQALEPIRDAGSSFETLSIKHF